MNTQAYEFLKAGRFDRFDTLYALDYDRAQEHFTDRGEVARALSKAEDCEPKYNSRCMGIEQGSDKRLYSFETWGKLSDVMARYADDREWAHLQRLDYQIPCDIDDEKIHGLYEHLRKNKARGRNVTSFDTRPREKSQGRHAGGHGVALGSHKSDKRLSISKRKGESGYIELQLSGKLLRTLVGEALQKVRTSQTGETMYQVMSQMCQAALEKMAREAGFETAQALVRSVSPDAPAQPPADFLVEAPVEMLVQTFMNLSPSEQSLALRRVMGEHYKSLNGE